MYDHYIGVDWSISTMAISRITNKSEKLSTIEVSSCIDSLKAYLKSLKGTKIMTIEESTSSQWLYMELAEHVDKLIICDPSRNHLLKEGSKTDKIDSVKLVKLLKSNLLKEVFHSLDDYIYLRRLVSSYNDLIQSIIRLKNQKSAILRAEGRDKKSSLKDSDNIFSKFVFEDKEIILNLLEERRKKYEEEFEKCYKKYPDIKRLTDIPGIGIINAVKIVSRVVDPFRFKNKGHFLSYCGLIKLERSSGGKTYSRVNFKYCRTLKCVFKTAALAGIQNEKNQFGKTYKYLMEEKKYPDYQARHAVARQIAVTTLGVMKSKKKYKMKMFNT